MILEHTKDFCVTSVNAYGCQLYFLNNYINKKANGCGGFYFNTLDEAREKMYYRQKKHDEAMERIKNNPVWKCFKKRAGKKNSMG